MMHPHIRGPVEIALRVRIQKVLSEGTDVIFFCWFLVDEGREDPNTTKSGPLSTRQRFAGGPMMAQH